MVNSRAQKEKLHSIKPKVQKDPTVTKIGKSPKGKKLNKSSY